VSVTTEVDVDVDGWCGLVRAEYLEMPGLQLTARQAQRLWQFDPGICHTVLRRLVDTGVLRERHGTYVLRTRPVMQR